MPYGKGVRTLYDREGHQFSFISLTSLQGLKQFPGDMGLDHRVVLFDTEETLSCFKGVALDPNYRRGQIFLIKDSFSIVGVATLIVVPSKNLAKRLFLKKVGNRLFVEPFSKMSLVNSSSVFLIEVGWLKILPEYQHKGLGEVIVAKGLIPVIKELRASASPKDEVIVMCTSEGIQNGMVQRFVSQAQDDYESGKSEGVLLTKEVKPYLGKTREESLFTPDAAQRMGLHLMKNEFDLSFAPMFATVFHEGSRDLAK